MPRRNHNFVRSCTIDRAAVRWIERKGGPRPEKWDLTQKKIYFFRPLLGVPGPYKKGGRTHPPGPTPQGRAILGNSGGGDPPLRTPDPRDFRGARTPDPGEFRGGVPGEFRGGDPGPGEFRGAVLGNSGGPDPGSWGIPGRRSWGIPGGRGPRILGNSGGGAARGPRILGNSGGGEDRKSLGIFAPWTRK